MRFCRIAIALLFTPIIALGQAQSFTGVIKASDTKLIIPNATISIDNTSNSVSARSDGAYNIDLDKAEQKLTISCIGYKSKTIDPEGNPTTYLEPISLNLAPLNLFASDYIIIDSLNSSLVLESRSFVLKEKFASYPGKWENFYDVVKRNIQDNPSYKTAKQYAESNFEIDASGKLTKLKVVSENQSFKMIVEESLSNLDDFIPASQNGLPVSQQFTLQISDELFMVVDKPAEPEGGYEAFYKYIRDNIEYPQLAIKTGIQGKVFIQFVVHEDGSVNDVVAIKTIGAGCDEEGVRLIKEGPRWVPPMQLNKPVRQSIVFPISFSLRSQQDKISPPQFKGGAGKLTEYIRKNQRTMNIPLPINRAQDQVRIEFLVKRNGKISDVEVIQSLGEPFDSEAVRLYSSMPAWAAAKDDGVPYNKTLQANVSFSTIPSAQLIQASEHYVKAINLASSEEHASAVEEFSLAILKSPTNLDYYAKRAASYFELNQVVQGCRDLKVIKAYDKESLNQYEELCSEQ